MENDSWFTTSKQSENLYLTREEKYSYDNRCNIWLVKGPQKDVIIDTGLGVCDLRQHLENLGLIGQKPCEVVCTHVHFDHTGGAHHFDDVHIHEDDLDGLKHGRQTLTLNYMKPEYLFEPPYKGFRASNYRVPATPANALRDQDRIDLGDGESLEVLHVPGHTKGSIALYHEQTQRLFSGDFVYQCNNGGDLLDFLPSSSVQEYVSSAEQMCDWLADHEIQTICPGHFENLSSERTQELLRQYVSAKDACCTRGCISCLRAVSWGYFRLGCFRCCPC